MTTILCVVTAKPHRIAFEDRLSFEFDVHGLLTVTIASVQHVLMAEEANCLRNWLLALGEEADSERRFGNLSRRLAAQQRRRKAP